jgi:hypothetical protein
MSRKKTNAKEFERAERKKNAVELRLAGASYREIGDALGCSTVTAMNDCKEALAEIPMQQADEMRTVELSRLDRLQRAVWGKAVKGDLQAVDRAIKIIDRRAKLLGLDAPQQVQITANDVDLDATVDKMLRVAEMALQQTTGGDDGFDDAPDPEFDIDNPEFGLDSDDDKS